MPNKKIGLAVIGYGGMGTYHTRHVEQKLGGLFQVAGAFDIREQRQQAALDDNYRAYESREELLCDPDVELVVVATPNDSHKEIVIDALRHGKHVVCEKPVTMTITDFEDIDRKSVV